MIGSKPSIGGSVIRLKEGLGVKSDAELARVLGIPASTVANWKSRGSAPVAVCLKAAADNNISLDWLIFGEEFPRLDAREIGMTAAVFGGVVLVGDDGEVLTFQEIGERFALCLNLIGQAVSNRASIEARRHAFDVLMGMLKEHQARSETRGEKSLPERMAGIEETDASADQATDAGAWAAATEAEREQAMERLAAAERSNALADEGRPRAEADAIAGREAGVSASAVGAWRGGIRGIANPEARKEALLDRPRTGRPTSLDASMQKTLEDLAMRRGRHLTAEDARQALVQRHGKAPNVSTIRRWLKRRQDDYKDSTPDPGRPLPPGVEALGGLDQAEAPRAGDETDLIDRIIDLAKTAISPLGIELGHEDYERLVAAIRELFNEMDDEEPEDGAARAADRVA